MFQTTIANESFAEGVGLHTGVHGHVRLVPAPADTGIVFRRVDLDNFPIEAQGHNVARVGYATSLMKQGVLLSTTEHLLAAIYSCGIDNIYIDINSIEVPILDGSAEPFMQMLQRSGIRKLRRKRRYLKILKPLKVVEGDRRIGIFPADEFGRHKALDLIGDLALAGLPLLARVEAHKAGHALHTQLVSRLLADPSLWTITTGETVHAERDALLTALSPAAATD